MRCGFRNGFWIFRSERKKIRISPAEIICLLAGILFFLGAEMADGGEGLAEGYVARERYGQGEDQIQVLVKGLPEEDQVLAFPVSQRRYTEDEARAAMDNLESRLGEMILGENSDLLHVRSPLALKKEDDQTGLAIRWFTLSPELVDTDGTVYGENADPEKGTEAVLQAEIRDGNGHIRETEFTVRVYPPVLSAEEESRKNLLELIRKEEERTRTDSGFYLPREYEGRSLVYGDPEGDDAFWLLLLGPAAALLIRLREKNREKEMQKRRTRLLLLDYSELVSRLQIFLGAGMTVHTAWEKIAEDYLENRRNGGEERPAYEELVQSCSMIRSGASEGRAYEEFGRRCGLPPYRKLAGLLEQNRKTGGKNLRQLLKLEVADAFEQRKNLARRQGEEASAKLLLPLFMMLGIVMVIVAVPAFVSFF